MNVLDITFEFIPDRSLGRAWQGRRSRIFSRSSRPRTWSVPPVLALTPSCRSLDPLPQRSRSAIVMRRTRRIVDQWRIRCTLNFLTVYGFQWTLYSTISSVGTFSQGKRHSYAKATSPMSLAKVSDLLIARWWRDPLAIRVPVCRM